MIRRSSRVLRTFLWIILAIFILFFASIAILPTLLSTTAGKETTLRVLNKYLPGHLTIQNAHLSWLGSQRIEGLRLDDSNGEQIIRFDSFSSNKSLLSFLFGYLTNHYNLGTTTLLSPYLNLVEDEKGELNFNKALNRKEKNYNSKKRSFPRIKGNLSVDKGEAILKGPKIDPITLSDISVEFHDETDIFHISAATKQGTVQGTILADGTFHDHVNLLVKITQFPVAILDQWQETTLFTEGIGKTLDLDIELHRTSQETTFDATVKSLNLNGTFQGGTKEGNFELYSGQTLTFTMTPAFFKQSIQETAVEKWHLASKADLVLTIDQLIFPLAMKKPKFEEILFSGTLILNRAEIVHNSLGNFSVNNFKALLKTEKNLQITYSGQIHGKAATEAEGEVVISNDKKVTFGSVVKSFPVDLLQLVIDDAESIAYLTGPTFDFTTQGTYEEGSLQSTIQLTSSQLNLQGTIEGPSMEELSVNLTGELLYSQRYSSIFGPSPQVAFSGEVALVDGTFEIPDLYLSLQNSFWNATVKGNVGKKGEPFSWDNVQLVMTGSVRKLPVQDEILINDGRIFAQMDGSKNTIQSQASLTTSLKGRTEKRLLEATAQVTQFIRENNLDFKAAYIEAKGNFEGFPIALLNPLVSEKINLVTFFGPSADIQFQGTHFAQDNPSTTLEIKANGEGFEGEMAVALDGTLTILQEKPAYFHWDMTPERYQAIMRLIRPDLEPEFVLMRTAPISMTITQFACPTTSISSVSSFLCQSGFTGDVRVRPMELRSRKTREQLTISDAEAIIQGENFSKAIMLKGKGNFLSSSIPSEEKAGYYFTGEMLNFWTPEGKWNRDTLTVKGELRLDLLPVKELTGFLPIEENSKQKIQALLGPLVNASIYGEISHLTGPLTIDIKSSNFKAILPVQLGNGILTLRETVEAELTLTPEINETFLKDVIPFLITGAWSEHPLKVYIDAEGFSLPFYPFSLQNVHVENAIIDLGRLYVKNGGEIQALMEFLKAKDIEEGIMEAWFTPIFVNLNQGVATYKRFDALLAGSVHIAMWGNIDLIRDRVHMILGISAATLQQRFNIKGVSKKDMFQVKMRGSTSNVDLDWSSAYTRIGILITKTTAGHIGLLIGSILEQIIGDLGDERTPPPSTTPFPWEK